MAVINRQNGDTLQFDCQDPGGFAVPSSSRYIYPTVYDCQGNLTSFFVPFLYYGLFNPCPAELFELYFSSFEAGIANAISSFN